MPRRVTKKRRRGGASILCTRCKTPTRVTRTVRTKNTVVERERRCPSCGDQTITREERVP